MSHLSTRVFNLKKKIHLSIGKKTEHFSILGICTVMIQHTYEYALSRFHDKI